MEKNSIFSEGFAMVGNINHRRVVAFLPGIQEGHGLREHVVGVEDGVVVGIDDFLTRAVPKVGRLAGRRKLPEPGGVALEVGGPMVTQRMQKQHMILLRPFDNFSRTNEEGFVKTVGINAIGGRRTYIGAPVIKAATGSLAA